MKLVFDKPIVASNHFEIPPDTSAWSTYGYRHVDGDQTPLRDRAPFRTSRLGMVAKSEIGNLMANKYGLYALAFDIPSPTLYVGIASEGGAAPEGVLSRIRKHRVKTTGSHVGAHEHATGGVHHPANWIKFATQRAKHFARQNIKDVCADMRIIIANLEGVPFQRKNLLECCEALLCVNDRGNLHRLYNLLWPESDPLKVNLLTVRHIKRIEGCDCEVEFWN